MHLSSAVLKRVKGFAKYFKQRCSSGTNKMASAQFLKMQADDVPCSDPRLPFFLVKASQFFPFCVERWTLKFAAEGQSYYFLNWISFFSVRYH